MSSFIIHGGKTLSGAIEPQGAKNEALQILCAVLLTKEKVTVSNIPYIRDVNKLIELLIQMGCTVNKIDEKTYSFEAKEISEDYLHSTEFWKKANELRGSIMLAGPILSRLGYAILPQPGGDKIGRRSLDTHFIGFEKLGAKVSYNAKDRYFKLDAPSGLKGCYILMEEASVTGTANIVMGSVLASGKTTIFNAACEPYLFQLCSMLNRMGAKISGVGSNLLQIEGVGELHGTEHRILPDMIEVGSFIGMAAITKSDITIKNVRKDFLGNIPNTFRKLGIHIDEIDDDLHIPAQDSYTIERKIDGGILTIYDAPWPGFTPDLISIVLVTATQARGSVLIHQKMFESRLFFVDNLINMGAQIILCDPHRATVIGLDRQTPLRGISMVSPDIRAGVSLLIAALSAQGESKIQNIEQIDRGYEYIDQRLNALGANIIRI